MQTTVTLKDMNVIRGCGSVIRCERGGFWERDMARLRRAERRQLAGELAPELATNETHPTDSRPQHYRRLLHAGKEH